MEHHMKYRLGEIETVSDAGLDFQGIGFKVLDENGATIVSFGYLDPGDAVKARNFVAGAIAEAKMIKTAG